MRDRSSNRLVGLDGLRGLAALAVAMLHSKLWLGDYAPRNGFLAVDLFFILSGFVIASVYGLQLRQEVIGVKRFLKLRVLRLYPVFIFGTILGGIVVLFSSLVSHRPGAIQSAIVSLPFSLLMIPQPFSVTLYPLDPQFWSIFYEMIINILFAFTARYWTVPVLSMIAIVFALLLVFIPGVFPGGGTTWEFWAQGLIRVGFGFPAGVLVYRLTCLECSLPRVPAISIVGVLACCLWFEPQWLEKSSVIVLFPILVYLASNSTYGPGTGNMMLWSGGISYALYAIHEPIFIVINSLAVRVPQLPQGLALGITALGLVVLFSAALDRLYDEPIRNMAKKSLERWDLNSHRKYEIL